MPCGTFSSSTMTVMITAITPSLNASSRPLPIVPSLKTGQGGNVTPLFRRRLARIPHDAAYSAVDAALTPHQGSRREPRAPPLRYLDSMGRRDRPPTHPVHSHSRQVAS